MDSNSEGICVAIRIRPLNDRELSGNQGLAFKCISSNAIALCNNDNQPIDGSQFFYDKIFDDSSSTSDVYNYTTKDIVRNVVRGINGTIFAYGQTSSGKTFTMLGDGHSRGVLEMASEDIFRNIASSPGRDFLIRVSFVEIYNEKIFDLLSDGIEPPLVNIREDPRKGVYCETTEIIITDYDSIQRALTKGTARRHVAETLMNEKSSRSHTIFRIVIESKANISTGSDKDGAVLVASLNLVDLAGSESVRLTGATGQRAKEGGKINQSLLSLSRVIQALSQPGQHVSFRDSQLTRLLQPSLSGNARMAIICCITPADRYLEETKSTLQFASRAKLVKTHATVNEVVDESVQIRRLKKELEELKRRYRKSSEGSTGSNNSLVFQEYQTKVDLEKNELLEKIELLENEKENHMRMIDKYRDLVTLDQGNEMMEDDLRDKSKSKVNKRETWCPGNKRKSRLSTDSETVTMETNDLKTKIEDLYTQLGFAIIGMKEKSIEIERLRAINSEVSDKYQTEMDSSVNRETSLTNELSDLKDILMAVETKAMVLENDVMTLRTINNEQAKHIDKLRSNYDSEIFAKDEKIKCLTEAIESVTRQCKDLTQSHSSMEKDLTDLRSEADQYAETIQLLQSEYQKVTEAKQHEINSLQIVLTNKDEIIQSMSCQISALETKCEELTNSKQLADNNVDYLTSEVESWNNRYNDLMIDFMQIKSSKQDLDDTNNYLSIARNEIKRLELTITEMETTTKSKDVEWNQIITQNNELIAKLTEEGNQLKIIANDMKAKYESEINNLRNDLESLVVESNEKLLMNNSEMRNLMETIATLEENCSMSKVQMDVMESEKNTIIKSLGINRDELDRVMKDYELLLDQLKEKSLCVKTMEERNEIATNQLEELTTELNEWKEKYERILLEMVQKDQLFSQTLDMKLMEAYKIIEEKDLSLNEIQRSQTDLLSTITHLQEKCSEMTQIMDAESLQSKKSIDLEIKLRMEIENKLFTVSNELSVMSTQYKDLQDSYESLKQSIDVSENTTISSLTLERDQALTKIEIMQSQIEDLLATKNSLTYDLSELVDQAQTLSLDKEERISCLENTIMVLKDKIISNETTIDRLESDIVVYRETKDFLDSKLQTTIDERSELETRVHHLSNLQDQLNDLREEYAKLSVQFKSVTENAPHKENGLNMNDDMSIEQDEDTQELLHEATMKITELQNELKSAEELILEMEKENKILVDNLQESNQREEQLIQALQESDEEMNQLKSQINELEYQLESAIDDYNQSLQTIHDLTRQIKEQSSIDLMCIRCNQNEDRIHELQVQRTDEKTAYEKTIESLKNDLSNIVQLKDVTINQLELDNHSIKEYQTELMNQYEIKLSSSYELISSLKQQIDTVKNEKNHITTQLSELVHQVEMNNDQIKLLTSEKQSMVEVERLSVECKLSELMDVVELKNKQISEFMSEMTLKSSQLSESMTDVNLKQKLIDDLIVEKDALESKLSELMVENETKYQQISEFMGEMTLKSSQLSESMTAVNLKQKLIDDLIVEKDALESKLSELMVENETKYQQITEFMHEKKVYETRMNSLIESNHYQELNYNKKLNEYVSLSNDHELLLSEFDALKNQYETLLASSTSQSNKTQLQMDFDVVKDENKQLQHQVNDLQTQLINIDRSVAKEQQLIMNTANQKIEALTNKLNETKEQSNSLMNELFTQKSMNQSLTLKCEELQDSYDQLVKESKTQSSQLELLKQSFEQQLDVKNQRINHLETCKLTQDQLNKIKVIQKERKQYLTENKQLLKELNELRTSSTKVASSLVSSSHDASQYQELNEKYIHSQSLIESMKDKLRECSKQLKIYENERDGIIMILEQYNINNNSKFLGLDTSVEGDGKDYDLSTSSFSVAEQDILHGINQLIQKFQDEQSALKKQSHDAQDQLAKTNLFKEELININKNLEKRLEAMKQLLKSTKEEFIQLQDDNNVLNQRIEELTKEVTEYRQKTQSSSETIHTEIQVLEEENIEIMKENKELRKQLTKLRLQLDNQSQQPTIEPSTGLTEKVSQSVNIPAPTTVTVVKNYDSNDVIETETMRLSKVENGLKRSFEQSKIDQQVNDENIINNVDRAVKGRRVRSKVLSSDKLPISNIPEETPGECNQS